MISNCRDALASSWRRKNRDQKNQGRRGLPFSNVALMQNMHARPACAKQGAAQQSVRRTDRRQHLAVDGCLADQNVGRYAKTWEVGNNPSAKSATGENLKGTRTQWKMHSCGRWSRYQPSAMWVGQSAPATLYLSWDRFARSMVQCIAEGSFWSWR